MPQLTERLKDLRGQRLGDEGEAAQLDMLLRAILLSRHDRDAGSSPILAEHRAHLERIWSDVEHLVCITARVAVRLHLRDADPRLRELAGDPDGAARLHQLAVERGRDAAERGDTDVLPELAKLHTMTGDPEGALILYREAADHGDTDALGTLALLRVEAGDPDGAADLYWEAADHGDTAALGTLP